MSKFTIRTTFTSLLPVRYVPGTWLVVCLYRPYVPGTRHVSCLYRPYVSGTRGMQSYPSHLAKCYYPTLFISSKWYLYLSDI
jgi:hypothetical protein